MSRTFKITVAAGVLSAGVVAGLIATVPGTAFAASRRADATTSSTAATTGSTVASQTATPSASPTTTLPSDPFCTPSTFSTAQQAVETALGGRVTALDALQTEVDNTANHLTASDRQTLQNDVADVELPGITGLQPQAQSATTCPTLRVVAHGMVFDYRVYVVMTPQTHLTIVADDETYIEGVFTGLEPTIAQAIANAQSAGKNVTAAQAAFSDLKNQVSAAQSASGGESATLLAQTPQGAPGNWSVFLAARTNLSNARTDLHAAYSDAQQIRSDLQ